MKIIQTLVKQIGGEFQIGRGNHDRGARFTVLFSSQPPSKPLVNGAKIALPVEPAMNIAAE